MADYVPCDWIVQPTPIEILSHLSTNKLHSKYFFRKNKTLAKVNFVSLHGLQNLICSVLLYLIYYLHENDWGDGTEK